jgi:hypothetical protein
MSTPCHATACDGSYKTLMRFNTMDAVLRMRPAVGEYNQAI